MGKVRRLKDKIRLCVGLLKIIEIRYNYPLLWDFTMFFLSWIHRVEAISFFLRGGGWLKKMSLLILVAAPLRSCSDFLKFSFRIHFQRACQMLIFSFGVVVSVELFERVTFNLHGREWKGQLRFRYQHRTYSSFFFQFPGERIIESRSFSA